MKSWKKFLIVSLSFLFVVTSVFAGLSNFGNANNNTNQNQSQNQESGVVTPSEPDNTYGGMIYYAGDGEDSGASEASREMKGGAIYIGDKSNFVMTGGVLENHEGMYGGAIYIANGGTFTMSGGTIEYNYSKYGGAIYVEKGGKCIINGGQILNNKSENAPAIYVEDEASLEVNNNAIIDDNEYIPYENTIINFYVGDVCIKSIKQSTPTLNLENIPLTYDECCGYFLDESLTCNIERGDNLKLYNEKNPQTINASNTSDGYAVYTLYTKFANPTDISFNLVGDYYYEVSGSSAEEIVIPKTYEGLPVLSLQSSAFEGCSTIKTIHLPSGITKIPENAFLSSSLESITITDKIEKLGSFAFMSSALKNFIISDNSSLSNINDNVFHDCQSLEQIKIPSSVSYVGHRAFRNCPAITRVDIGAIDSWMSIEFFQGNSNPLINGSSYLYSNNELVEHIDVDIPSINSFVFCGYIGLKTATLTENVVKIGESTFQGCINLESINLPNSITEIKRAAFINCVMLETITIPNSLDIIKDYTFSDCTGLKTLTFSDNCNVSSIDGRAFANCSSLEAIQLPKSIRSIGGFTFTNCSGVSYISINDGLETCGQQAFSNCTGVNRIYFENCTITDPTLQYVFKDIGINAESLEVEIDSIGGKNSVIPSYMFNGCTGITKLVINDGISSIGTYAFQNCINIEEIEYNLISFSSNYKHYDAPFINAGNGNTTLNCSGEGYNFSAYLFFGANIENVSGNISNISNNVFQNCKSLVNFNTSSENLIVGNASFAGCSALETLSINSVNQADFKSNAFIDCENIKNVYISGSNLWAQTFSFETPSANPLYYGNAKLLNNSSIITKFLMSSNFGSKIGNYSFYNYKYLESSYGVTEIIGNDAFYGCSNLSDVDISGISLVIGSGAFDSCSNLKKFSATNLSIQDNGSKINQCPIETLSLNIETVGKFLINNSTLKEVKVNNNTKIIDKNAFDAASNLISFEYSSTLTDIENYAFRNCKNLSTVISKDSVTNITEIGEGAFYSCSNLSVMTFPMLKEIGAYAFASCGALEMFYASQDLITIGDHAFHNCSALTNFESLMKSEGYNPYVELSIGVQAFYNCSNLKIFKASYNEIYYNDYIEIKHIGDHAFEECSNLIKIDLSFCNTIGIAAFKNCTSLSSDFIQFGGSLSNIGAYAFNGCSSLIYIDLTSKTGSGSLLTIGGSAFGNCSGAQSITIPKNVVSIGVSSFSNCRNVGCVNYNAENATVPNGASNISPFRSVGADVTVCTVNVGKYVSTIPDFLFSSSGITSLNLLGSYINTIGMESFGYSTRLSTIIFNQQLKTIKYAAFTGCIALEYINLSHGFEESKDIPAEAGESYATSFANNFLNLRIETYAFQNCTNLKNADLQGVSYICKSAFAGCSNLETARLFRSINVEITMYYFTNNDYSYMNHLEDGTNVIYVASVLKSPSEYDIVIMAG